MTNLDKELDEKIKELVSKNAEYVYDYDLEDNIKSLIATVNKENEHDAYNRGFLAGELETEKRLSDD